VGELITEVTTELRIRGLCAIQALRLGAYERALDHLLAADSLVPLVPPSLVTAHIAWTRALLEQWRNAPRVAVGYALSALTFYREHGSRIEEARLRQQAANIVLDCTSAALAQGKQAMAEADLDIARMLLDFEGPRPTGLYAGAIDDVYRLVYARYSRLSGRNENRVPLIESVGAHARRGLDQTLSGQVYTALGDEFAAQGRWGEALACYRRAIDLLTKSNTPALAAWPLRHLARAQEMGVH
jgi:tetratricopeptide (TPR) repeat protein